MTMSTNKRYRLKKNIDSPEGFCRIGTVGKFKNGVHRFDYTNNEGSYMIADDYIKENVKYTPKTHCFFEEAPTEEIKESEFAIGVDPVRGSLIWSDETKKAVVFKKDDTGDYVMLYHCKPESQKEFEAELKKVTELYSKVPLLCEECGEIGKHKPTCSKASPDERKVEGRDWEIVQMKAEGGRPHGVITKVNKYGGSGMTCEEHGCKIHSVKRLSDGEVFSIGDNFKWDWKQSALSFFTIKEFQLDPPDNIYFIPVTGNNFSFKHLKNLTKLPSTSTQQPTGNPLEERGYHRSSDLQQPEPEKKVFTWNEDLVFDLLEKYASNYIPKNERSWANAIYEFKKSKLSLPIETKMADINTDEGRRQRNISEPVQPSSNKAERIEVVDVGYDHDNEHGWWYCFGTKTQIGGDILKKYAAIKQAIERVLNNPSVAYIGEVHKNFLDVDTAYEFDKNNVKVNGEKYYSKKEMDEAITLAFNAARERNDKTEIALQIKPFLKYTNVDEYLKTLQP